MAISAKKSSSPSTLVPDQIPQASLAKGKTSPNNSTARLLALSQLSTTAVFASFIKAIEESTGLRICVYDLAFFLKNPKLHLSHQHQIHDCQFCHHVKSNPECFRVCMETENKRISLAAAADAPILHTCHAGVSDLIFPVKRRGELVGAVFIGQAHTLDKVTLNQKFHELSQRFNFPLSDIEKAGASLPHLSPEALQRKVPFLFGIADYLEQNIELDALRAELNLQGQVPDFSPTRTSGDVASLPTPVIDYLKANLSNSQPKSINKALEIIRRSYWINPTARSVAREVGMSEFHFSRSFRKATTITFRQCLLECRLTAAFYLLKGFRLTIEQAALSVGYDSGPSLQRAFKNFTGMTPHAFLRTFPRADSLVQLGKRE